MTTLGSGPCIEYEGTKNKAGYGVLPAPVHGSRLAHRAVLAAKLGRPLDGHALHTCDNPPCIAENHLYEGSPQDNCDDAVARGRAKGGRYDQTQCKWGHDLTPDNVTTYQRRSTRSVIAARRCTKCRKRYNKEQAARRKAARRLAKMGA